MLRFAHSSDDDADDDDEDFLMLNGFLVAFTFSIQNDRER